MTEKTNAQIVKSYEEIEKDSMLIFEAKRQEGKINFLKREYITDEAWKKNKDMKMLPRHRLAYSLGLLGTLFFIVLVKEVNTAGGYFYRDESMLFMDNTVHTITDREARYKIDEYKRKFREIDN